MKVWKNRGSSEQIKSLKSDHIGDGDFWSLWRGWSLSEVKNVLAL
jgi:hypothetical protein